MYLYINIKNHIHMYAFSSNPTPQGLLWHTPFPHIFSFTVRNMASIILNVFTYLHNLPQNSYNQILSCEWLATAKPLSPQCRFCPTGC